MGSEWRKTRLGQILLFSNGRSSPERADCLPYPVYGSNGIIGYANETNSDPGTIIIGRVGSYCGSLYFSRQSCWVTDNAIRAVTLNDNSPDYSYYLLLTLHLNHWRGGSGQPLLNQSTLRSIPVSIPEPKEQRAIAAILGALDDKIELNRQMNATLEAIARALFKSWFVDFDPVRAKAEGRRMKAEIAALFPDEFVDSALGEIPKGWKIGTLGDVATHPRRGVQPSDIEPSTPYIALEHMPRRCIALTDWGTADDLQSNKFEFKKGEILFGKLRPYFHKVGVAPLNGVCSTDIVVMAPLTEKWFGFVLGHVSSAVFVEYTNAGSTGTKMPRTSWNEMARYRVVMPPEVVAEAFTKQVCPLVDRIIVAIHESRTLAALRDTLLSKLISGEVRVPDAERIIGRYV